MDCRNDNIPRHVAIIMDGNGRWAEQQGQERLYGHGRGVESVRSVVQTAVELGVEYLTIYAFSTENWGRPAQEVDGLMSLLSQTILAETDALATNGVRMRFIGNLEGLPANLQDTLRQAEQTPIEQVRMTLVIALNYSSRWEIARAVQWIVAEGRTSDEITESLIADHLATRGIPDPELLIRTSGEQRLSNFLLWQLSYTELYFTPTLWPDFDGKAFSEAIRAYTLRDRRFGRISVHS